MSVLQPAAATSFPTNQNLSVQASVSDSSEGQIVSANLEGRVVQERSPSASMPTNVLSLISEYTAAEKTDVDTLTEFVWKETSTDPDPGIAAKASKIAGHVHV